MCPATGLWLPAREWRPADGSLQTPLCSSGRAECFNKQTLAPTEEQPQANWPNPGGFWTPPDLLQTSVKETS